MSTPLRRRIARICIAVSIAVILAAAADHSPLTAVSLCGWPCASIIASTAYLRSGRRP